MKRIAIRNRFYYAIHFFINFISVTAASIAFLYLLVSKNPDSRQISICVMISIASILAFAINTVTWSLRKEREDASL